MSHCFEGAIWDLVPAEVNNDIENHVERLTQIWMVDLMPSSNVLCPVLEEFLTAALDDFVHLAAA
jgi:hypothetical protein